jgi:hypothetical protein
VAALDDDDNHTRHASKRQREHLRLDGFAQALMQQPQHVPLTQKDR